MGLEHALLVALAERPAAGADLARRFERSIGYFWSATHQQIYRVLGRMEGDGWVAASEHAQADRPTRKVYAATALGREALAAWLAEPTGVTPLRSDLAVKLRGAAYGDRAQVRAMVEGARADHVLRLEHWRSLAKTDFPDPAALTGADLDHHLVLRGGILLEEAQVAWLTEYLEAQP